MTISITHIILMNLHRFHIQDCLSDQMTKGRIEFKSRIFSRFCENNSIKIHGANGTFQRISNDQINPTIIDDHQRYSSKRLDFQQYRQSTPEGRKDHSDLWKHTIRLFRFYFPHLSGSICSGRTTSAPAAIISSRGAKSSMQFEPI